GTIGPAGFGGSAVDLGQGGRIRTVASGPIRKALIAFLQVAGAPARGESPAHRIPGATAPEPHRVLAGFLGGDSSAPGVREAELGAARWAWPQVVAASAKARSLGAELRTFESRSHVASRALVTPAIVLICIAVYALMVAATIA